LQSGAYLARGSKKKYGMVKVGIIFEDSDPGRHMAQKRKEVHGSSLQGVLLLNPRRKKLN
jgi:hypothetical protein